MYYLYVFRSDQQQRYYIGVTGKLPKERLEKHNRGSVKSTKPYRPWRVVHFEKFDTRSVARKREAFLKKNARARQDIFDKIKNGPIV